MYIRMINDVITDGSSLEFILLIDLEGDAELNDNSRRKEDLARHLVKAGT